MISITIGKYNIDLQKGALPWNYNHYIFNSRMAEEYALNTSGETLFISVREGDKLPYLLTIGQKYYPSEGGFNPGITLVEERNTLFIGAGQRILVYDLLNFKKIDEDFFAEGFLGWLRYKDYVIMLAECDIAGWNSQGKKLWQRFADPPYTIAFEENTVNLSMFDKSLKFDIKDGGSY